MNAAATPSRSDDPRGGRSGVRSPRVLIIEDELKTTAFLEKGLIENGFEVASRQDGEQGLVEAAASQYDLIILDVGLPRKDGWAVIDELKAARVSAPVIFLTAHDGIAERVRGLDKGADDYLVKPFAFAELLARVRMVLRRQSSRPGASMSVADLTVDLSTQRAYRNGHRIDLSQTELALLMVLMKHSPNPVPRRLLVEQVWDMHFDSNTNVVEVTVKRLRAKIDDPYPLQLIRTVRGIGYTCAPE